MASFVLLLGLCYIAVANPLASITADVEANDLVTTNAPAVSDYIGCYHEGTMGRALTRSALTHPLLTVGVCRDFCRGYRFCKSRLGILFRLWWVLAVSDIICSIDGLEYGDECYCGYQLLNSAYQVPESSCTVPCVGDPTETCGGGNLLST